jgi:thiol-disulfide isomerase/thioredoxin
MLKKDRDFLKQLYKSYLVVMIGTGIILSSIYLTVEYKVIYHLSLYGVLAWLILSIVLSPLFIYTKGMKHIQEHFILSNWSTLLFLLPTIVALSVGMIVAHQENRQQMTSYNIGISFMDYQKSTFRPYTDKQTTELAEKLEAAGQKERVLDDKGYYIFYKTTCPYCKVGLTSLLERLPEDKRQNLVFIDLNSNDAERVANALGVDKAGTVVAVVKDKENGNSKLMKETIAFDDDDKDEIVANKDLIDKIVAKENV